MKKAILILLGILISFSVYSQKEITGTSGYNEFYIYKTPPKPPILTISNLSFVDNNGNKAIDANENCKLTFIVKNSGYGKASGIKAIISTKTYAPGVSFNKKTALSVIDIGGSLKVSININSNISTTDGIITFVIKIDEPNGFGTSAYEMDVTTRAFVSPLVKVTDYSVTSSMTGKLIKKMPFDIQILVQNTKYGLAENVRVNLDIPQNVICLSGNENLYFPTLQVGETKDIVYSLIVSGNYTSMNIPVTIKISEKNGKYAENKTINLELNQNMASNKIVVNPDIKDNTNIIDISKLHSNVDTDIPDLGKSYSNRFALIIGNQDYKFLASLQEAYTLNDAMAFKIYAEKLFGIPANNIYYIPNATKDDLSKMPGTKYYKLLNRLNSNSEVIVYYSGHGIADNNGNGYILPTNANVIYNNVEKRIEIINGIKTSDFLNEIANKNIKQLIVFTDACFSGTDKGDASISKNIAKNGMRQVKKDDVLPNNTIYFSATTDASPAYPYQDAKHGLFTYALLKALKNSNGNLSYEQLFDKIQIEMNNIVNGASFNFNATQAPTHKQTVQNWSTITVNP